MIRLSICGHTRLEAAKKLGMERVPCIRCDDLSPEKVKALRLADNKVGEFSIWDEDLLSEELEELAQFEDFQMLDFGFIDEKEDATNDSATDDKGVSTESEYCIIVECETESELQDTFERLSEEGYKCRISTL